MSRLSDKELNAKLMESMNISSSEAKNAFNELMKQKVAEIRQEVRQEIFEELSKQAKQDKHNIVESLNIVANQAIAEEKKKNDIHRKNLIKEKLSLQEAKNNMDKIIEDRVALVKEQYTKKLEESVKSIKSKLMEQKIDFINKASDFINEMMKKQVMETKNNSKQVAESLEHFGKFVSEQIKEQVKERKEEIKSLDALRVRLVKENESKLASAKKKFFTEAADKMEKFTNAVIAREVKEFRKDMIESRKNSFGKKLYEAFEQEFAIKFFNENKVVSSMMESVKSSQAKLKEANKNLEKDLMNSKKQISNLAKINESLSREKIINDSISHLTKDKQNMIKNLVKDVTTERLQESINKYIPMILSNKSEKTINKNESNRVLKEGRGSTFLTGDRQNFANDFFKDDLDKDIDMEIEKVIANGKF